MSWGELARSLTAAAADTPDTTAPHSRTGWAAHPPAGHLDSFVAEPFPASDGLVTRDQAMQVPAFARGVDVIAATGSTFPLMEYDGDGMRVGQWPVAPIVDRGTMEDLIMHGWAVWQVAALTTVYGAPRPSRFDYVDPDRVEFPEDGRADLIRIDDMARLVLRGDPSVEPRVGDAVVFRASRWGALAKGRRVLRTALAQEEAAQRFAEYPMPQVVVKNTGADLPAEKVSALLDGFEQARRTRSAAYANAVIDLATLGFDASQSQFVESRAATDRAIANLLNIDPAWVAAGVPGGSVTYQNRQDLARQLVDMTLKPILMPIEYRLSRPDILPGNRRVRYELDAFLRGNPNDRAAVWGQMITSGVLTVDEARALEPLVPNAAQEGDL